MTATAAKDGLVLSDVWISTCPVCDSSLAPTRYVVHRVPIRQCSQCNHLVGAISEQAHSEANLEWNKDEGTWPKSIRRLERRRLRTLRQAAVLLGRKMKGLRLLDVGCSNGSLLDIALRHGLDPEGVEPAERAADDAIRRGFTVHKGYVESLSGSYDVITTFEVIEHLRDPLPMLSACYRLLVPGGILVVGTGNTDSWTFRVLGTRWDYMNPGTGHINYFSSHSLSRLAERAGFRLAKISTRAVSFRNRDQPGYRFWKLISQSLAIPARMLGKGEQLEIFLRKPYADNSIG